MAERLWEFLLRWIALPPDVNRGGKAHGGTLMKWMDQAADAAARGAPIRAVHPC